MAIDKITFIFINRKNVYSIIIALVLSFVVCLTFFWLLIDFHPMEYLDPQTGKLDSSFLITDFLKVWLVIFSILAILFFLITMLYSFFDKYRKRKCRVEQATGIDAIVKNFAKASF